MFCMENKSPAGISGRAFASCSFLLKFHQTMDAADILMTDGVSVEVIDPVTIKPFDEELILNEAKGKRLVVTYENHGTVNGIGSAVADVLAKNGVGVPLLKLGATEIFGQVGMVDRLKEAYHLTARDAVVAIHKALG